MHSILEEEEDFILPPDMAREYLKVVNYITTANITKLKRSLNFFQDLRKFICPDSGYNLIGVAIIHNAPISVINLLIELKVSIDGIEEGSKIPLKAIPFVHPTLEQIDAAYELIKAGAKYDFYDNEATLWLDGCYQFNKRLYAKIGQAIIDRAKQEGEFEAPIEECLNSRRHKKIFFDAKLAVNLRRAELQHQQEELLELRPKILHAKRLAEQELEQAVQEGVGCSIKMQIINRNVDGAEDRVTDFLMERAEVVDIGDNLKKMFKRSKKKFEEAKRIAKHSPDNAEANRIIALYHRNGWGGAKRDADLTEINSGVSEASVAPFMKKLRSTI